jgi:dTMP kinase
VASDVVDHYRGEIAVQLAAGRPVVWDRGPLCYEAYARAYGADLTWVLRMLRLVPWPDVTFLLDLSPRTAWQRIRARSEKAALTSENPEFLERVRECYLKVAATRDDVVVLDAELPRAELTERVLGVLRAGRRRSDRPVPRR